MRRLGGDAYTAAITGENAADAADESASCSQLTVSLLGTFTGFYFIAAYLLCSCCCCCCFWDLDDEGTRLPTAPSLL